MMQWIELFQTEPVVFYTTVGLFGLLIGSFLNVVIYRLPLMMKYEWFQGCLEVLEDTSKSKAKYKQTLKTVTQNTHTPTKINMALPPSTCPKCNTRIRWWQNIPVLSFLLLKGRCYSCQQKISWRYPIVELTAGLVAIFCATQFGPTWLFIITICFSWFLLTMTMIDADCQLLPDSLTLGLMWIGLMLSLTGLTISPLDAIIGAIVGYLSLWSFYWVFKLITGKDGMGYGDFKLNAALGAWVGWTHIPVIIILAAVVGSIIGLLLLLRGHNRHAPIPFGPYLAVAGWVTLFYGDQLIQLYWQALV